MILSRDNIVIYAAKHYEVKSSLTVEEFHSDLKKSKHIGRLLRLSSTEGAVKERLLLNHIIVFFNCFGSKAGSNILFMESEGAHSQLKAYMDFLGYTPRVIEYDDLCFHTDSIQADPNVAEIIRRI